MKRKTLLVGACVLGGIIKLISLFLIFIVVLFYIGFVMLKRDVDTDIKNYESNKSIIRSEIFPESITDNMNIKEYKYVYADRWNSESYITYLTIEYDKNNYNTEVERLKARPSVEYKGLYNVTGFTKYDLLAIAASDATEYNKGGFTYALTDNKNKIIYVDLTFSRFCYEYNYKKDINSDYLPDGFSCK